MTNLTALPIWQNLLQHQTEMAEVRLQDLFKTNPLRESEFNLAAAGLQLNYAKNIISSTTIKLLCELAENCNLSMQIKQLFAGEKLNITEQQAALHTALRDLNHTPIQINSTNIVTDIASTLEKMAVMSEALRTQQWRGYTDKSITDVVNIGIGGSDTGPRLATTALESYKNTTLNCHFIANIDGVMLSKLFNTLNPATTLFIISSKSFTTVETLTNADTAKQWLIDNGCPLTQLTKHFIAITAKPAAAQTFGIAAENILPLWDWIGGRFSLWSAIGLPLVISIGITQFKQLLSGAYAMDQHFQHNPFSQNMPVILALLGIWHINFWHFHQHTILPYAENLNLLPMYLQQLEMESNGKHVQRDGKEVNYHTAPIVWGGTGTCSQHTFHQLLYQGTIVSPSDFIIPLTPNHNLQNHHRLLVTNAYAQSEAFMRGKSYTEAYADLLTQGYTETAVLKLAPHKVIVGNRPNNVLTMPKLDPYHLGALIALYEHKVFVQGCIWNINSFDQWGVELGKTIANDL